jgi:hypothetical protein
MRHASIGAVLLVAATAAGAQAQTIKLDVPAGLVLSTVREPAPRKEIKPDKGLLKELRPGQCRTTPAHSAPVSSWPARGEPLVAFCRP